MPLKLGPITPEMNESIQKAFQAENEFWERNGFPGYTSSDENGMANVAHKGWVRVCEKEGRAYDSPMARRLFVLGYLTAKRHWNLPQEPTDDPNSQPEGCRLRIKELEAENKTLTYTLDMCKGDLAEIHRLRAALEWYADASNWETRSGKIHLAPVWADLGTTAHAALEGFCQRHNLLPGIGGRCDACEALKGKT